MKKISHFKKAFTLVEILVSVSILTILGIFGLGRYRDFNKNEQLRQAVRNVKTGLQEAQKRAQAGEIHEGLCDGLTFEGWALVFESETSFRIEGRCSGVAFSPKSFSDLPPGISFVYPSPGEEITFRPGGLGASANLTIILEGSGSRRESLRVYSSGEIALLASAPPVPTPSPSPSPSPERWHVRMAGYHKQLAGVKIYMAVQGPINVATMALARLVVAIYIVMVVVAVPVKGERVVGILADLVVIAQELVLLAEAVRLATGMIAVVMSWAPWGGAVRFASELDSLGVQLWGTVLVCIVEEDQ